ncbi:DNA (cytosine-5)-methyltransferase 3-like [Apodemus speciosus]|uniref:DNA (Cytosine-5)-methyltransferase 3-like n=1 Tax=Apodemus speciosus TaxID=105296 RepID=A0ABQ0F818_APOSI
MAPDLKEEDSVDVILKDSEEPLSLSSPPSGREIIRYEVKVNRRNIEDVCLGCGTLQVYTQHPLFEGGICASCKDKFLETLFLYDEDGHQSYCTICSSGGTLFICESPDCTRCYCFECVDILVGPGTSERINAMACWVCFLCLPFSRSGLLQRRKRWRHQLKVFQDREGRKPCGDIQDSVCVEETASAGAEPFGNIDKVIEELGLFEGGSGSAGGTLKYVEMSRMS